MRNSLSFVPGVPEERHTVDVQRVIRGIIVPGRSIPCPGMRDISPGAGLCPVPLFNLLPAFKVIRGVQVRLVLKEDHVEIGLGRLTPYPKADNRIQRGSPPVEARYLDASCCQY